MAVSFVLEAVLSELPKEKGGALLQEAGLPGVRNRDARGRDSSSQDQIRGIPRTPHSSSFNPPPRCPGRVAAPDERPRWSCAEPRQVRCRDGPRADSREDPWLNSPVRRFAGVTAAGMTVRRKIRKPPLLGARGAGLDSVVRLLVVYFSSPRILSQMRRLSSKR